MEQRVMTKERPRMPDENETCPYKVVHDLQWRTLREDLGELKARVQRLETTLARGVTLLIANLAGVIALLLQQLV
ncbi:MAG: hypothetical protein U9Q79_00475 [Candidatus Hydrogenedentes bacterium]|nr:hypothetical protein [Candidatus Hydrogenedentota bacterium]